MVDCRISSIRVREGGGSRALYADVLQVDAKTAALTRFSWYSTCPFRRAINSVLCSSAVAARPRLGLLRAEIIDEHLGQLFVDLGRPHALTERI
jgi:hypothetical protein